jgi:Secretion system C-terminal sorting domain
VPNTPTSVTSLNNTQQLAMYPTVVTQNRFTLNLPVAFVQLQIINMNGVIVQQQNISNRTGAMDVALQQIPAGMYIVKLTGDKKVWMGKMVVQQ